MLVTTADTWALARHVGLVSTLVAYAQSRHIHIQAHVTVNWSLLHRRRVHHPVAKGVGDLSSQPRIACSCYQTVEGALFDASDKVKRDSGRLRRQRGRKMLPDSCTYVFPDSNASMLPQGGMHVVITYFPYRCKPCCSQRISTPRRRTGNVQRTLSGWAVWTCLLGSGFIHSFSFPSTPLPVRTEP